jgi:pimeloyl-ACP methyl ester carboxylesterase
MFPALILAILIGASATPPEERVPVGGASLYARDVGRGQPIVVLHGGPDFDHSYLLPDLDRLSGAFRLLYYEPARRGARPRAGPMAPAPESRAVGSR